ncbi:hypothetical protein CDL15_Pgr015807 [Punica granatum]|uniref:Uncharacterized protein n=1 Tax=Punica granatum TaxID=22663 RepID=A0A218XQH5_PUNGR|nr:hypothetical protein CDL15_Pgr015807 [Punica granatum]
MRLSNDEQLTGHCFGKEAFKGLKNLRFLEWYWLSFDGDLSRLFKSLRWLSWHSCPEDFTATNLNLQNLVILDLSWSGISEQWDGWSRIKMGHLKVLDLTGCKNLTKSPDFSKYTALERLILADCEALTEIDRSVGKLKRLKHLNVRGCDSLRGGTLLMGALPREMESLSRLKVLDLLNTRIPELFSVSKFSLLQILDLEKCHQLRELPELPKSLVSLHESFRSLQKLPDFSELHNLVDLKLFDASGDWALGLVLAKIGAYRLNGSFSFDALMNADGEPSDSIEWVQKMSKLVTLELSLRNFTNLPTDFHALTRLKVLELSCPHISSPPQFPFTLSRLILGHLVVEQNLLDLSHLKNLSYLRFYDYLIVDGFFRIGIKVLHSLNALMIDSCEIYDLCGCCLPENLRSISIYRCHLLRDQRVPLAGKLEDLSKLQKLEVLEVEDCDSLVDVEGEGGIRATQDLTDERQFAETPGELMVIGGHSQHSLQISTRSLDSLRDLSLTDIYRFWT